MALTRKEPREEGKAALVHLFRAVQAAVLAPVLFLVGTVFSEIETQPPSPAWWSGVTVFTAGAAIAAVAAAGFLVAALRRVAGWFTARRHRRMLMDPVQAALVPPRPTHLHSRSAGPGRRTLSDFGAGLLLMALASAGLLPGDDEYLERVLAAAVVSLLGLVAFASGFANLRRWTIARRVERLSTHGEGARETAAGESPARAAAIPPLVTSLPVLQRPAGPPQPVTARRNVLGREPWNIAYLRVFDNEQGLTRLLASAWRECGYVHLIRGTTSVRPHELEALEAGTPLFINSREWLIAELEARPVDVLPPGDVEFDTVATEIVKAHDPYGSYPVCALLCHDSFWKVAVDVLLERADVVVLDLSGYHWENAGTGYELQRVVDRRPVHTCVVLADAVSDRPFLDAQIQRAWSQMAGGSPNAGSDRRDLLVWQPVSHGDARSESRALAELVQQRLDAGRPAGAADSEGAYARPVGQSCRKRRATSTSHF